MVFRVSPRKSLSARTLIAETRPSRFIRRPRNSIPRAIKARRSCLGERYIVSIRPCRDPINETRGGGGERRRGEKARERKRDEREEIAVHNDIDDCVTQHALIAIARIEEFPLDRKPRLINRTYKWIPTYRGRVDHESRTPTSRNNVVGRQSRRRTCYASRVESKKRRVKRGNTSVEFTLKNGI